MIRRTPPSRTHHQRLRTDKSSKRASISLRIRNRRLLTGRNDDRNELSSRTHHRHHLPLILTGVVLLAATAIGGLAIGRAMLSPAQVVEVLRYALTGEGDPSLAARSIVLQVRLPRVVAAVMIGAALSVSGTTYQGLFRNPMVSPAILGASAGASFGAVLALLVSDSRAAVQVGAFVGGIVAVMLTYFSARRIGRGTNQVLLLVLCGMIVSALFQAFVSAVKYTADPDSKLPAITYWLMGSIAKVTWADLALYAVPFTAGIVPIVLLRWRLNTLAFGDEEAESLGIDVTSLRATCIVCATLLTASSVAISGVIGWVGLIMPHLVRFTAGPDNRIVVPLSLLLGATFLIAVDTVCRTVVASEIPLGILTSVIGAPLFFVILLRSQRGAPQ